MPEIGDDPFDGNERAGSEVTDRATLSSLANRLVLGQEVGQSVSGAADLAVEPVRDPAPAGRARARCRAPGSPGSHGALFGIDGVDGLPEEGARVERAHKPGRKADQQVVVARGGRAARGSRPSRTGDVVGPSCGREWLERLGMHPEQVVALHRVEDRELPVAGPFLRFLLFGPVCHGVEAVCGDMRRHRSEALGERLSLGVQADEDQAVPRLHPVGRQAVRRLVDGISWCVRHRQQPPAVVVGPRVVRTLDPLGVGRPVDQQRAPMGAQVRQRGEIAVLLADEQHRLPADDHRQLVAGIGHGIGGGDEHPVAVPDRIQLRGKDHRVTKGDIGQCRIGVEHHLSGTHVSSIREMTQTINGR